MKLARKLLLIGACCLLPQVGIAGVLADGRNVPEKTETRVAADKVEAKAPTDKVEAKPVAEKVEVRSPSAKAEVKVAANNGETKPAPPRAEARTEAPKVFAKKDEAKPAASKIEPKVDSTRSQKSANRDPRIKHVVYDPNQVVRIDAYPGIATHIVFAKGETVIDHGTGFSKAWELVPNGQGGSGHYFLKPKATAGDTNLFIVTNKREYSFDLVLHKDWRKKMTDNLPMMSRMTYRIVFSYPHDEAEKLAQSFEKKYVKGLLKAGPKPRNWNYTMHVNEKSEDIAPKMAFDDGRFTYLRFPNNREIPTIYLVAEDNSESIVNHHVIDDVVVVQRLGRQFMLRLDKMAVGLFNESYDPDGVAPKHGMTVDGLKRSIKVGDE
jgi:type IV secretion system protein VirB9